MSANYSYVVQLAQRLGGSTGGPIKLLDYGCGRGEVVSAALERGLDAYGVDLYYAGGSARKMAMAGSLWGARILELKDDKFIPFPDASFDLVTANQVFEHIEDFSLPVQEVHRALKPGGVFVNVFPSALTWREGHIGIPFSHWMKRDGRFRYWYTLALRSLGLGYKKGNSGPRQWTETRLEWIDVWTFYKPIAKIDAAFAPYFTSERQDADYIAYRIEQHPFLRRFARLGRSDVMKPILALIGSRLASHVFILRKPEGKLQKDAVASARDSVGQHAD